MAILHTFAFYLIHSLEISHTILLKSSIFQ
nr:MAG TPA: hypothetical protein [Caudoviricetes sp.]